SGPGVLPIAVPTDQSAASGTPAAGASGTPAAAATAGAAAAASPAPAAASPAGATPTPVGAAASSAGASGAKGHLEKGPDGHFAFFQLDYPGKRAVYTIDVRITPESSVAATWAGFRVYGPEKNRIYVRGGPQLGLPWNVSGNLIADAPGTYVVQVFNYDPNTGVDYELRLTSD